MRQNYLLVSSFLLSLIMFFFVSFYVTKQSYDQMVITWIGEHTSPALQKSMDIISMLGSSEVILLVTVLIGLVFLMKRDWVHFILFFIVSVGGVILNLAMKLIFQRERPGGDISYIEVFNFSFELPSYSYPSGHTMRSTILLLFVMYLASIFIRKNYLRVTTYIISFVLIFLVALSRLMLEAHFLSDTLGAVMISIAWVSLSLYIYNKYKMANKRRAIYRN